MAYTPVDIIEIICWNKRVGAIALDPSLGYYAFEYYPEFAKDDIELAPLTIPVAETDPVAFPYLSENTYYRLPAFVADSIPDTFGNNLINAWMARNGVSPGQITPLDRLAYMGKRAMGALEFRPAIRENKPRPSALEMNGLIDAARKAVHVDLAEKKSGVDESELSQLITVGTSAGGARAKAVVGFDPANNDFISGQFNLPKRYEHWLIKFDIPAQEFAGESREYGRIEYAYHLMAKAAGIEMEDCLLFESDGRAHFMTKRFDRDGNQKHHIQSLCAMSELDFNQRQAHDYSQLFQAAEALNLGFEAMDQIFLRMVFNVLMGNNDDHTKNYSFTLKQDKDWELSPAYDITFANDPANKWLSQHLMSVNGKFSDITKDDLIEVGKRFYVADPPGIIDKVMDIGSKWVEFAGDAGLSRSETVRIKTGIEGLSSLY